MTQVYAELRRESAISHGMPIAVRHLESMIRMAEAHAAMHLREYVNDDDIDTAIRCVVSLSFTCHLNPAYRMVLLAMCCTSTKALPEASSTRTIRRSVHCLCHASPDLTSYRLSPSCGDAALYSHMLPAYWT